jgi:hypothetical protein
VKITVPFSGVKVPPLLTHAPLVLMVLVPPFKKVPEEIVVVPVKECANPDPRFSVPPDPLTVNVAPLILPFNVAVPPVFDIVTVPVVVNPAIY